jgi:hypothetical protein
MLLEVFFDIVGLTAVIDSFPDEDAASFRPANHEELVGVVVRVYAVGFGLPLDLIESGERLGDQTRSKLAGGNPAAVMSATSGRMRWVSPRAATVAVSRSINGAWLSMATMNPEVSSARWRVCPPTPQPMSSTDG